MDTCTFISGSTTLNIPTHSRKIPQNFQQLEKESSNTVALPGFNHNADATTHIETSRNVHNNGALSTSLKMDTNMNANMDTNHTAHRYRHTRKEDTFFQDHLNSNRLRTQKLRSLIQYTSSYQDKNTADSQKPIKLSFRTHLFTMMIETLSGTILSVRFHQTMSS